MIKFFRQMRKSLIEKNQMGKYFKYAIGEILLVVIGILIALQINNWNEQRKADIKEKTVLENFAQNLDVDLRSYRNNQVELLQLDTLYKALYEIGVNDRNDIPIKHPNYIRRGISFNPIAKDTDPFITNEINNQFIKEKILIYFRLSKDLEDTLENLDLVLYEMRRYLRINNVNNLSGWFENENASTLGNFQYGQMIPEKELIVVARTSEFQQLVLELSIKTTDFILKIESIIEQNKELKDLIENHHN